MGGVQGCLSYELGNSSAPTHAVSREAVKVEGVTRRFPGGIVAVDSISLSVSAGEFMCLLGPSGSGKTTLLRIIGGFETADEGRVTLLGEDVTHTPPAARRTNMVFQHHALFPHLNVHDNIAFGPRMRKVPEPEITRRIPQVLELVRLSGYETRPIDQLSGGQRQRVAIARAIINDPAVLLLDEPLGALDLRLRQELQDELRRLQRSLGSPFVAVTHDQHEAMAMSDRIAVMNQGRIEQVGTPDEIYNHPQTLFVAQFIGHTNLLKGSIVEILGPRDYIIMVGGLSVPCPGPPGLLRGQAVALSLREELISLETPRSVAPSSGEFRAQGTIADRMFLGPQARFTVRLTNDLSLVAEVRADGVSDAWAIGARVQVRWRSGHVRVFQA